MSLPGGISLPGAELVHRVRDIVPGSETLVVVNCAGRTRSIIGAQSLIDAGLLNRVVALENGTMGWALSGRELEHNSERSPGPPSDAARTWARQAAADVAQRYAVPAIDDAMISRWRAEAEEHTLYVCDVRGPEEYRAGHLPGSLSAPGGQLVQATDSYLATHNARVVLVDDDGVRSRMTAAWLVRMGRRNVYVLDGGLDGELEVGRAPRTIPGLGEARQVAPVDVPESATVIDLADSLRFANGHIAGAKWCVRARLAATLQDSGQIVLTSPHGVLAKVATGDLAGRAVALAGGTDAWEAAGLPMAKGTDGMIGEVDDRHLLPYDYPPDEIEGAMRGYLDWETGLVPRIERDGTLTFSA
jgi:rhodanese-related sulfurtransferase